MEHLCLIMTRHVTDFISLSSLSRHAKMLSQLNCAVPHQFVYAHERGNEGDLDSSCLSLGSTWTLGLSAQGKGQHGTEDGQEGTEM